MTRGVAAVLLAAAFAAAQEKRPDTPQSALPPPIFTSDTDLVLVDVVVTDKKDKAILDLTPADFRVSEDGVDRKIESFASFGAASVRALETGAVPGSDRAAPLAPAGFVPAATVIYIDEGHLTPHEAEEVRKALEPVLQALVVRKSAILFLAPFSNIAFGGRLPEDVDRVQEARARFRGRKIQIDASNPVTEAEALSIESGDTSVLDRVVKRFIFLKPGLAGQKPEDLVKMIATQIVVEERNARGDTLGAMRVGLNWLDRQPGRHTFLMVSPGFTNDPRDTKFNDILNQSFRVNAPIHFLDCGTPSATGRFQGIQNRYALPPNISVQAFDFAEGQAGADVLAVDSGGLHISVNDVDRGLKKIIDATRTYYVLGYERVPNAKAGFRKIRVEVTRKDVRVRARRGYFDAGRSPSPTPLPARGISTSEGAFRSDA